MSAQPLPRLSPEEYLAMERAAEFRSEYYNGRMYAMAGGSYRHICIIGNITGELWAPLKGRCRAMSSDLRLRVAAEGLYTYPDIVVVCGEARFADDQRDTLINPTLIIEVLSPSTEGYDRGFKSAQYRTIDSLREYALVSQTEPRVEVFERQAGGHWLLTEFVGVEATCRFASIECGIALADVYAGATFSVDTNTDVRPGEDAGSATSAPIKSS